ncbi:protocadherin gamma-A10 isoform X32 [Manis pentadactyla]|uniref:protocadherin gamma-A10 isoform X32 n=1 Tax=Manis pentadactyla TaxID=143292 RepID=UPI001873C3D1|nr:protocadherin gamma-A10 isoform X32 [Manis pentadactyla]
MAAQRNRSDQRALVLLCLFLGVPWEAEARQIRYSVPEELDKGSFVGNIAQDLGLEPRELAERGVRIVSRGRMQLFALNARSGSLVTAGRIDREELCAQSARCLQAPPNTDWRFSQAQRPGTSGSQNGDETGTWPNNQFDTEMLQAMILASASEAADGSSTLGGGAGTMGLSARYGPQFTLQHVPDYRQNVYIPGSNATLTNAAGKRDGKAPAGGNGNKKKSGKKEKK